MRRVVRYGDCSAERSPPDAVRSTDFHSLFTQTHSREHMSYASQAANYRELEILSASPERLVVIVFDALVVQLERARIGTERNDLELQVAGLTKARAILGELLATLDFEKGGDVADRLAELYQFMLVELMDVGQRGDLAMMRRLASIASQLRDGFTGAAEQLQPRRMSA